jgi:L,D-peptidoglycan transpeptidase YkuD (ErfK/YbiS/YcfS/YnhG family)
MRPALLFACVSLLARTLSVQPLVAHANTAGGDSLSESTQLIVVTTSDWHAVEGKLQKFERATARDKWHPVGEPFAVVVGEKGLAWGLGLNSTEERGIRDASDPMKREGDGTAPAGIFALGMAFGDAPQPLSGQKLSYQPLTSSIECVDDASSEHYNRIVDRSTVTPDWNSSEHMLNVGELYRWGIVVGHNGAAADSTSPKPGGGSCVFLHIWRSSTQGTAGCTAMPQREIETLLTWLDPKRNPRLVQLPGSEYQRLITRWNLPPLSR